MWRLMRAIPPDSQGAEDILDIFLNITRVTTVFLTSLLIFGTFLAGATQPVNYLTQLMLISLLPILIGWLSYYLLNTHPHLAIVIWQAGMFASITLAFYLFKWPVFVLFYAILPLVAVISGGWQFGLLIDGLMVIAVVVLGRYPEIFPFPRDYQLLVIYGGSLIGMLAAFAVTELLAVANHFIVESKIARVQTEDARRQRVELMQVERDLIQANRGLARLSDRLKALTQIAEDARRVKEEFVANVSHELRTPLNMIIGFSELIAKAPRIYGQLPPALLADIAAIQRNSQHLSELVNDVLDLSQVEAGRMTLVKDWTTIQDLVKTAVSATQVLFDTKGLYLETELPEEPMPLFCDRTRIREVLLNLLSNAGRYTHKGGVRVKAYFEGDVLQVSVSDTGPGIAPEDISRLFEPFQQLDNSIRREGGSGLGLSISKRFVEMHDGKMWLESHVGEGTTFYFSLPMRSTAIDARESSNALRWSNRYDQPDVELHRSKAPAPEIAPRFMILDRDNMLQRLFSHYIGDVELSVVQTLDEARQEISHLPVQGLLINGASLDLPPDKIASLKLPFLTPVITCWLAGDEQATKKLGVVKYLVKPINRERLLGAIDDVSQSIGREIKTILLVDDQAEVLQLFVRMLATNNNRNIVLRAQDGRQALQILRERQPDVMLLDLVMQGMDGFQVLNEKNQDETIRDIPVIVISSQDPTGAPIVSNLITVGRSGGLSARELLTCIRQLSEILAPEAPFAGRERPISAPT